MARKPTPQAPEPEIKLQRDGAAAKLNDRIAKGHALLATKIGNAADIGLLESNYATVDMNKL